ncbi:ATP-binding cassette domain-containing protein [Myceligenerans pegani]|uniref:ATP-binding cassette domain-containing protein n=1 Tax=Myceligenerans pegani TaxID=2776917 RepID=A0ABR9MXC6_9MICO|nr:ATP-binding cassette domain-containing protein [Myceligenerans sp. TRM 65318]MBE1876043.1 ATP-binding cassette domain-containing protein [Myceligenerans sp. TRM 65318]MBE3018314.1 ATP-binding cassette domain-containing protein [Myceligenerans sp. TRM 65318]
MPAPPLIARGLRKRYGDTVALNGFDLEVAPGAVHALLGPNGAGKSTAVGVFATLTRCDDGEVRVAGHDVRRDAAAVRAAIGLVGQGTALDEVLFGRENLVMFGRLHGLSLPAARERADELLESFGLADAADRKVSTYSGGMRRRLDIAAGLIRRPVLLFLDEPTTGLDPRARNEVWQTIRQVVAAGTTVLLTTQYLDEADQLADRVTVMNHGKVVAEGSPAELKRRLGGDRVLVTAPLGADLEALATKLGGVAEHELRQVVIEAGPEGGAAAVTAVVRALDAEGVVVDDILLRRPTLDEVFLSLTGAGTTAPAPAASTPTTEGGQR